MHDKPEHSEYRRPALDQNYRLAVQSCPCGMFVCDSRGVFILVNLAFERLTGYRAEQLVGHMTFEALHDPSELAKRHNELLATSYASTGPTSDSPFTPEFGPESEWTYVRHNQSRVDVSLAMTRLTGGNGEFEGCVGAVFDNTKRTQQDARLWYLSHHDALTGLPNQTLLEEHLGIALERRRRSGDRLLLAFLEIDNLRKLHDTLGQAAAEIAVRQVAKRLRTACGPDQTLAIVRANQFAIVSAGTDKLGSKREAELLAQVALPIEYSCTTLHLTASIGASTFPDAGDEPRTLIHRALLALSAARNDGGNCARHFDFDMQSQSAQRLDLEGLLRDAIPKRQFSLAYQPQIDLNTGKISLAEALLRWRHPQRGFIGPSDFIPVAEDMGLILQIGEWVLQTACKQAARMVAKFGDSPRISVNVSPVQFRRQDVLAMIKQALDSAMLDPKYLEIEITEGVLLNDTEQAIATLAGLRKLGVEIAIDDFGTGYSSLSYLTRFQVDRIKIDRSLVTAMTTVKNGDAIVSAIIAMAHALDIRVTAEGVETGAQAERLRALQCDEVQGYWFSRPLTPQALENALAPISSTLI